VQKGAKFRSQKANRSFALDDTYALIKSKKSVLIVASRLT